MLCYLLLSLASLQCDQSNYPANTSFTNNNNMFGLLRWDQYPGPLMGKYYFCQTFALHMGIYLIDRQEGLCYYKACFGFLSSSMADMRATPGMGA